jgi:hypothetical protein
MATTVKCRRAQMGGATSWSRERAAAVARTGRGKLEVQLDANGIFRVYLGPSAGKGNIIARGNVGDDPEHKLHFVAGDGRFRRMNPHGRVEEPRG